jgi:hypothetical protein
VNNITFPLEGGMQSPEVANLQDALLIFLEKSIILPNDEAARKELSAGLRQRERVEQKYGDITAKLVSIFQGQKNLERSGKVDEPTANAINALLRDLGLLEQKPVQSSLIVSGKVKYENDLPFKGRRVQAFHEFEKGTIRLGEDTTDSEGRYTIRYELLPGIASVNLCVEAYGDDGTLLQASEIVREAKPVEIIDLTIPAASRPPEQRRLEGRVVFENGLPAEQLNLRLYRLDFGGAGTQLSETKTRELGLYTLPFDLGGKPADLEIRAIDASGSETSLSKRIHDLGNEARVIVNLVAPAKLQPLATEYQRLVADLTPHIGEMKALASAQENAERQDLTLLNRATGWDARLIALASNTEKLNQDPDLQLPEEAVYGLLRAGLPSEKLQLAQVDAEFVEQALKNVREAGIVSLNDDQVAEARTGFEKFANQVRLKIPVPGSSSTYKDLLESSGLDEDTRNKFASAFLQSSRDTSLWENARKAGLNEGQIQTLQLQGKLAFLTGNSMEMTGKLQQEISDPRELAEKDYFTASKWEAEIRTAAGVRLDVTINELSEAEKQKLQTLIPQSYTGEKLEDNFKAYTEDMARKVRLSYPTQVLGRRVEQDTDDTFKLGEARSDTAMLLKNAAAEGFKLGQTSIDAFVAANSEVLNGIGNIETAKKHVKTLQRVYQITPSDEVMPVLVKLGLTSAYDIVNLSKEEFIDRFIREFPSRKEAELVYRKAKQVNSVTYNLFTVAKKLESEPQIYGASAPIQSREKVKNELIKQFPTMESLFGSMDFCDCEHCRSVLSPAAYLVDLLQFIDAEPEEWENFLVHWKATHDQEYTAEYKKPYDALIERRPDIPHIPLTCENTLTALPYIDIVNEILEYYVANEKLTEDAAHDTGNATSEELLAEPQNVIEGAYDKLQQALYPLNLPFDLWLETVRGFCSYFEVPLSQLLEAFRAGDELFAATLPYDREAIFIESLGLSPSEYAIFTDPTPLENDKWYKLYGYPTIRPLIGSPENTENATLTIPDADAAEFSEGDICTYFDTSNNILYTEEKEIREIGGPGSGGPGKTTIRFVGIWKADPPLIGPPDAGDLLVFDAPNTLKSAKTLSRRLGVTYRELVDIIQTGFVNPELVKLALLYKLGVTIQDVMFYKDKKAFYEQNKDLIGKERDGLSTGDQQRFDAITKEQWEQLNEVEAFEKQLQNLTEKYPSSGIDLKSWLNNEIENNILDNILVLADRDASCNFDETTLTYAGGKPADPIAFLKINLFVRLWRKLGWTIEETDRALQAFVPKNVPFDADATHLKQQPLKTALIYLSHFKALNEQVNTGKSSRLQLITLWSDLSITGEEPLYARLFLTHSMLKSGEVFDNEAKKYVSVFDDPLGQYLSEAGLTAMAKRIRYEVSQENVKPADKIDPAPFAAHPEVSFNYDDLREVQSLAYHGVLTDTDKAQLEALSVSPALVPLLGAVQTRAKEFTLIKGHLLTLQGALGLTADEISGIIVDAGMSIDTAQLSLQNVSLLYRYGLLAKALKLSIKELIALKQLSGLDPFKLLNPDPLSSLSEDFPFSQTLRFIEIAEQVNESGLKLEALDYILRHQFDKTGKYRPNTDAGLVLIKELADGIRAIRALHALPAGPDAVDEEMLRQKLGLVLPSDVVERFLAMMNGKIEFTATKTGVLPEDKLDSETFKDEPSVREVSYIGKDAQNVQKLIFRGVLSQTEKERLTTQFPSPVFAELLDEVEMQIKQVRLSLDNYLKKQKLSLNSEAGFLEENELNTLFEQGKPLLKILPGDTEQQIEEKLKENETITQENQTELQERRFLVAKAFLPFLQQHLIRQFIIETMTAQTGADPDLVNALLSDARLLGGSQPLLEAFKAASQQEVNVAFFDGTDTKLGINLFADTDTALKDREGKILKPAGTDKALFEGYLEVPISGTYRFYAAFDKKDATAELWLFDRKDTETGVSYEELIRMFDPLLKGVASKDGDEIGSLPEDKSVVLKSGIPYRFVLELQNLNGGDARLLVQGETLPKDTLAQLTLYSRDSLDRADRALVLLNKTLQLIQGLGISEREVYYLLTNPADFGDLDLSKLPVRTADSTPEGAKVLFAQFLRLSGYARLKKELAGGTDDLIEIFEALTPDQAYPLIAKLTRREEITAKTTARALFFDQNIKNELTLNRIWEALQVVERFGVSVESLLEWTRIVSKTAIPEQRFSIARDLKEAIKARFEPETWQRIAQPIFDALRQLQRDSLVAYIMHKHGFVRMEQLYEYFLIDPGMEPVVQTSRIRLAISALQLFIQRCLINLEKDVPPSVINSSQWEWMKRYRVWEANRKIFLFPENWLEPEFRDDKTYLFSELESNLLQGDVSNDLAEDAFLNYLKKLEELARLDIVAMHLEDNPDPGLRTLHVIGRTYSQPHKYFYRSYAHEMWTAWEPVTAEIEGDHLAPVIWRDRLYLFWVTFMEKAKPSTGNLQIDFKTPVSVPATVETEVEAQLHWSEYLQGKWSTRKSGGFNMPDSRKIKANVSTDPRNVFIHVSKEPYENGEERGVYINLSWPFNQAFYLAGRNSNPERAGYSSKPGNPYSPNVISATRYSGNGAFKVTFGRRITTEDNKWPVELYETPDILGGSYAGDYTLLPCDNDISLIDPEIASLVKPLFYQDNSNTLFIEPNVEEQTIEEWQEWVTRTPKPKPDWVLPERWKDFVKPMVPKPKLPIPVDPGDPVWHLPLEEESLVEMQHSQDWLVNPATRLQFDGEIIGSAGRTELAVLSAAEVTNAISRGDMPVNILAGSEIAPGSTAATLEGTALERGALKQAGLVQVKDLNIVGSSGFNSVLARNFDALKRSNFGAGTLDKKLIER